jgi:hypothetical protein
MSAASEVVKIWCVGMRVWWKRGDEAEVKKDEVSQLVSTTRGSYRETWPVTANLAPKLGKLSSDSDPRKHEIRANDLDHPESSQ